MTRRFLILVTMLGLFAAPLGAELKYTMKTEARPSSVQATTPPNPLLTMLSGMVVGAIAPPGGLETTVIVGERGARMEYNKAYTLVPAGGVMIIGPDGSIIVTNPAAKTFWKVPRPDAAAGAGRAPTVSMKPTGEFASIVGVRAERSAVEIRVSLPVPAGMPGVPTELVMTGDAWLAEQYKKYSVLSAGLFAMGSVGMDKMASSGLMMRSIMRSDLFGGQEIESVVTSIGEVTVPASLFQVPEGYTETQPPMPTLPNLPMPR